MWNKLFLRFQSIRNQTDWSALREVEERRIWIDDLDRIFQAVNSEDNFEVSRLLVELEPPSLRLRPSGPAEGTHNPSTAPAENQSVAGTSVENEAIIRPLLDRFDLIERRLRELSVGSTSR